ncbi:hypothetical protein V3C99_012776 [Haemonchus contortus]
MPEEGTTPSGEGSSTAQPKVYQLTQEALQSLIQAQMGAASSSVPPSGHIFSRTGLERQFKFNQEIIDIIRPIIDLALEGNIRDSLSKAVALLNARNELLIVADGDVSVFAFYDQHKKAEVTKDPILAEFLKKKEQEETKKKSAAWKTNRFDPFQRSKTPFRFPRAAWAPAPHRFMPERAYYFPGADGQGTSDNYRMEKRPMGRSASQKDMCYGCGRFGHFVEECKFPRRSK